MYLEGSDLKAFTIGARIRRDCNRAPESILQRAQCRCRTARKCRRDIRRNRQVPASSGLRPRLAAQGAQRLVRNGDCGLDKRAAGTRFEQRFGEGAAAAGSHELEVPEPSPAEDLRACGVTGQLLSERIADALAQPVITQTDKIDD